MKKLFITLSVILLWLPAYMLQAHGSLSEHKADFYAILPFCQNPELDEWMKCISSDMIDNYRGVIRPEFGDLNFYDYLKKKFPPFKCKHRALFHWGYNSTPWSDYLQAKVEGYGWDAGKIAIFKKELVQEQQRRNHAANEMTENIFGHASSGRDASYANALISIVYDIHLIGDYTSDNSDLDGLQLFTSAVGDLINSLRKLDDSELSRRLIREIQKAVNTSEDVQIRADRLMELLYREGPSFFVKAQNGSLAGRWEKRGLSLK
ncbi:MAG: hypothetical protein KBS57_01400 [Alistipes sp.]|nr:hypothetical protein [Candidatus Minthomonas equi]